MQTKAEHRRHVRWSTKLLSGTVLMGFGIFNLVEGVPLPQPAG